MLLRPIVLLAWLCCACAAQAKQLQGLNISGAEFAEIGKNGRTGFGVVGKDYRWPGPGDLRNYLLPGLDVVRLPFRWERVQPELMGPVQVGEMVRFASDAASEGVQVIIDMHNYGNRWVNIGGQFRQGQIDGPSGLVTSANFADAWGKIAMAFRGLENVHFDLMNEPHDMKSADGASEAVQVGRFYQAAIDAIRATGAKNFIHIEPPGWAKPGVLAGAFSPVALGLRDPLDRLIFHVHQYVDAGEKGIVKTVNGDTDAGARRLAVATRWATAHKKRLFLGEFGVAADGDARSLAAATAMLQHVREEQSTWVGWTAWGGGAPWKQEYPFRIGSKSSPTSAGRFLSDFAAQLK